MKITRTEISPINTRQKIIKRSTELARSLQENVTENMLDNIDKFKSESDTLTDDDIKTIIKIASEAATQMFIEYGKERARYGDEL